MIRWYVDNRRSDAGARDQCPVRVRRQGERPRHRKAGAPTRRNAPSGNACVTERAGRNEWIGLAVISLACVLYVIDHFVQW